jgi:hypothetical protein
MTTQLPTYLPIISVPAVLSILAPTLYSAIPLATFMARPPVVPEPPASSASSEGLMGEFELEMQ